MLPHLPHENNQTELNFKLDISGILWYNGATIGDRLMRWRTIEAAMLRILRGQGFRLDQAAASGDNFIIEYPPGDNPLNITEFAIALAAELEEPAHER